MKYGICDILREKMMAYIEPRDESVRWLSQRVGLPYSSVYRIISREAHNCTFRNAYQILKVVAPDEAKSILVEHFPNFSPLIEQDKNFVENESKLDKALDLVLQTKMLYLVHSMASTALGTTRTEIKETYGRVGVEALDLLLEEEILAERRDGIIKDLLFETMGSNEDQARQAIRYNLDGFQAADKYSGIVNVIEGYNDQGAQEVLVIVKEALAKVEALRKDPTKWGKHRMFLSIVCGRFDAQINKAEEVRK
jgi:hypothetical protein